jgi:hypothetical protein
LSIRERVTERTRCQEGSGFLSERDEREDMSLTADDFAEYSRSSDDNDQSLGDALADLSIDVDVDSVEAVRETRERI